MQAPNHDYVLRVSGLTKSYGDLVAVNDLSLDICRGEILGFLGPNGAGKTTAINMICGLLQRDAGEIFIDGIPLTGHLRECRKRMGLCPQNLVIWESLTCQEQLELMGRLYDLRPKAAQEKARELLEILGLSEKKHRLARTLSGGMKRRLNIGLALVHEPQILILDEPTAGLDPQSRVLVREYIRSLAKKMTVVLTTHEMDEAERLADRVAIIDHGRLLVLDTPKNLKNHIGEGDILEITLAEGQEEKLQLLRQDLPEDIRHLTSQQGTLRLVGIDIANVLPVLAEKFRHYRLKIEDMTIRKKSLEDVFIALTGRRLRE